MRLRPDFAYLLVLLVQFGFGGGINAAGFGFSVEEVVDYFPMVKLVDGAVKRNQSPGRDRSSRWCAIWEVGSQGRFLASATMIVFLNVMKTTLPFGEFPLARVPGQSKRCAPSRERLCAALSESSGHPPGGSLRSPRQRVAVAGKQTLVPGNPGEM